MIERRLAASRVAAHDAGTPPNPTPPALPAGAGLGDPVMELLGNLVGATCIEETMFCSRITRCRYFDVTSCPFTGAMSGTCEGDADDLHGARSTLNSARFACVGTTLAFVRVNSPRTRAFNPDIETTLTKSPKSALGKRGRGRMTQRNTPIRAHDGSISGSTNLHGMEKPPV